MFACVAGAEQLVTDRPDHSILLSIESKPAGAEIYSIPATTNAEPVRIGATPAVTPVALRWGTGWMRKKWNKLAVSTVGDFCASAYDEKAKEYTLSVKFLLRLSGYEDKVIEEPIASFAYYEDLDFDHIKGIPNRQTIVAEMKPLPAGTSAAPARKSSTSVVLAGQGGQGKIGTLLLDANVPQAEVIVDGKPSGSTPVKLILSEGDHDIVVQKSGYRLYQTGVTIAPDSEVSLKARLDSAN